MSETWEVRAERAITSAHFFLNEGSDAEIPPAASEAWHIIHDMRDVIAEALRAGRASLSKEVREAIALAADEIDRMARCVGQKKLTRLEYEEVFGKHASAAATLRSFLSVSTE